MSRHNKELIQEILNKQQYRCFYCKRKFYAVYHTSRGPTHERDFTIDHIIPISKGGNSDRDNLVGCCWGCNKHKQDLSPEEFRVTLEKAQASIWNKKMTSLWRVFESGNRRLQSQ